MHSILIKNFISQVLLEQDAPNVDVNVEEGPSIASDSLGNLNSNLLELMRIGASYRSEIRTTGEKSPDLDALMKLIALARGCLAAGQTSKTYVELMALCIGFSGKDADLEGVKQAKIGLLGDLRSKTVKPAAEGAEDSGFLEETLIRSLVREIYLVEAPTPRAVLQELFPSLTRTAESQTELVSKVASALGRAVDDAAITRELNERFVTILAACSQSVSRNFDQSLEDLLVGMGKSFSKIDPGEAVEKINSINMRALLRDSFSSISRRFVLNSYGQTLDVTISNILDRPLREAAGASSDLAALERELVGYIRDYPARADEWIEALADVRAVRRTINSLAGDAAAPADATVEKVIRSIATQVPDQAAYPVQKVGQKTSAAGGRGATAVARGAVAGGKKVLAVTPDLVTLPLTRRAWKALASQQGQDVRNFFRKFTKIIATPATFAADMAVLQLVFYAIGAGVEWGEAFLDGMEKPEVAEDAASIMAVMAIGPDAVKDFGAYLKGLSYQKPIAPEAATSALSTYGAVADLFGNLGIEGFTNFATKTGAAVDSVWNLAQSFPEGLMTSTINIDVGFKQGPAVTAALQAIGGAFEGFGAALAAAYADFRNPENLLFVGPDATATITVIDKILSPERFNVLFVPAFAGIGVENEPPTSVRPAVPPAEALGPKQESRRMRRRLG